MSIADVTQTTGTGTGPAADRKLLRLSATLLGGGFIFWFLVSGLHPRGVPDYDHPAVFAEYAKSAPWTAVHLGQFAGIAVMIVGLLVLLYALNLQGGMPGLVARLGSLSARRSPLVPWSMRWTESFSSGRWMPG